MGEGLEAYRVDRPRAWEAKLQTLKTLTPARDAWPTTGHGPDPVRDSDVGTGTTLPRIHRLGLWVTPRWTATLMSHDRHVHSRRPHLRHMRHWLHHTAASATLLRPQMPDRSSYEAAEDRRATRTQTTGTTRPAERHPGDSIHLAIRTESTTRTPGPGRSRGPARTATRGATMVLVIAEVLAPFTVRGIDGRMAEAGQRVLLTPDTATRMADSQAITIIEAIAEP